MTDIKTALELAPPVGSRVYHFWGDNEYLVRRMHRWESTRFPGTFLDDSYFDPTSRKSYYKGFHTKETPEEDWD